MLFLRTITTTAVALAGIVSALPLTTEAVQERQLSAIAGLLPELGPLLDGLLEGFLRRDEHALEVRQSGGGGGLGSLSSLSSLLGGLGGSGADGRAGTAGTGQAAGGGIAGQSGNVRGGKSTPGSGLNVRQLGGIGGGGGGGGLDSLLGPLGGLLGGGGLARRDIDVEPRQVSTNGSPGLGGILGGLGPLLGGGLGSGALRRDDGTTLDRRQLDAVTGLLSSLEPLLKGLGL